MHLGKDGTSDREQVVSAIGNFRDSDVNSTWICSEINSLTEFWLKLYACANIVYQAFVFHPPQNTKAWGRGYKNTSHYNSCCCTIVAFCSPCSNLANHDQKHKE